MYERSRDGVVGERGSPPACSKPLSALDQPLTSFFEVLAMNLGLKGDMGSFHRADLLLLQFQTGCMCISAEVPVLGIYALCR